MSNKSKYQYKDPVDYGMKRVKLSRKDHDLIFPKYPLDKFVWDICGEFFH